MVPILNHKYCRCSIEWESNGCYMMGSEAICLECHSKEMEEYHKRRIKNLNDDLLETDIIKEILKKLE